MLCYCDDIHCILLIFLQLNLLKAQLVVTSRKLAVIKLNISIISMIQEIYHLCSVHHGPRYPSCHASVASI